MSNVFVVTNQHGHFLDKHKEWVDGRERKLIFRTPHKDEAINQVFEMSSKDIYLRAEAIEVPLDEKGQPEVEVTAEIPTEKETQAEAVDTPATDADAFELLPSESVIEADSEEEIH